MKFKHSSRLLKASAFILAAALSSCAAASLAFGADVASSSTQLCSVRFIADNTSYVTFGSDRYEEITVDAATALENQAPVAVAKSGYTFDGWYKDGVKVTDAGDGLASYIVNDACTFIAHSTKSSGIETSEISGSNRFDTAVSVSKIDSQTTGAIIVNGRNYPDALSAASLSGVTGYHVFIVDSPGATTEVPETVRQRLIDLGIGTAIIVGGESAVSSDAEATITAILQDNVGLDNASVTRLSGNSRTETAESVYNCCIDSWSDTIVLSTGYDWTAAMSISPYCTWSKSPILLVDKNGDLSTSTKSIIKTAVQSRGVKRIVIVENGDSDYGVSSATESYCEGLLANVEGAEVVSLSGDDVYETSSDVASWCVDQGMSYDGMGIASATSFVDSMVSAPCLGRQGSVLILASDSNASRSVFEPLIDSGLSSVRFIGGTGAVPMQVRDEFITGIKAGQISEGSQGAGYASEAMLGYALPNETSSVVASVDAGAELTYTSIGSGWAVTTIGGTKCYVQSARIQSDLPKYTVTFEVDDIENGSLDGAEAISTTYSLGDTLSDCPSVTTEDCIFEGWYKDGVKFASSAGGLGGLYATESTTYVAHFTKTGSITATEISGETRYDTAVEVSKAFSEAKGQTEGVIIASGANFPDALSACSVVGITGYHILLTNGSSLSASVVAEIESLGATNAYVIGGTSAVSENAYSEVKSCLEKNAEAAGTTASIKRISGKTRQETAEAVYSEFADSWGDTVILATGANYPDSLSISPYSTYKQIPILITTTKGVLADSTFNLMKSSGVKNVIIVGGTGVVSSDIEKQLNNAGIEVDRLAGSNRYETSAKILEYCCDNGLQLDGLGIVSGKNFPDALAGGSYMGIQGKAILLVADSSVSRKCFQSYITDGNLTNVTFIGGLAAVPQGIRDEFTKGIILDADDDYSGSKLTGYATEDLVYYAAPSTLSTLVGSVKESTKLTYWKYGSDWAQLSIDGRTYYAKRSLINSGITYEKYNITLSQAANMQYGNATDWTGSSKSSLSTIKTYLDPNNYSTTNYMFLDLQGYTGISASSLNSYLSGKGTLAGLGSAFVEASKASNINEAYLVAHACLESANGGSRLASGTYYDGTYFYSSKSSKTKLTNTDGSVIKLTGYKAGTYYNFFGYGAINSNPFGGGITTAVKQGWNSPAAAVKGGAKMITGNYINNSTYNQNTLYKMRFNPVAMEENGKIAHQYATDIQWAESNAKNIKKIYESAGGTYDLRYIIPQYK